MLVHPLEILSVQEVNIARDVVLGNHPKTIIDFRNIFLQEPAKAELIKFLALEHSGRLSPTSPRPARLAQIQYDVIGSDKIPVYNEATVDVEKKKVVKHEVISREHHAPLTM